MTGDKIVAVIAIMGMLMLVIPRLVDRQLPGSKLLRMALLWVLIVAVVAAVIFLMKPLG
ncbi:hypothetical protein [Sphingomonas sp. Root710]|uniref:hypothetical protein n=1 Tax=Sphingomonas sp. Root710 TaxID=1736594 RepID=UPI000B09A870|nr:hypothetical protein [Sphingomonas sp. Root710]